MRGSGYLIVGMAWLLAPAGLAWASNPSEKASGEADPALGLVRQLGDPSFGVRQVASHKLVALGRQAKKALLAGNTDPDLEIRKRCRYLLPLALKLDLDARLVAFIADKEGKLTHDLPGWTRFRTMVGADADSRELFITMQKAGAEMLETAENDPKAGATQFAGRCQYLQQFVFNWNGQTQSVPLADFANLLFLATDAKVKAKMPPNAHSQFAGLLNYRLTQQMPVGAEGDRIKKMVVVWIQQCSESDVAQQALNLAIQLNLKEGLDLALKEIKNKSAQGWSRATAVAAVGKLGGKEHLPVLEPLLKDKAQVTTWNVNNLQVVTEVRDVALAMVVKLTGQNLKDYGFAMTEVWPNWENDVYSNTYMLGFTDEKKRDAAQKKWKDWGALQAQSAPAAPVHKGAIK